MSEQLWKHTVAEIGFGSDSEHLDKPVVCTCGQAFYSLSMFHVHMENENKIPVVEACIPFNELFDII